MVLTTQRALQATTDSSGDYFAKDGLQLKPGTGFEVSVATSSPSDVALEWGSLPFAVRSLTVPPCSISSPTQWLDFVGGYVAARPTCAEIVVRVGSAQHTVHVGIGVACPGQEPAINDPQPAG